MALAKKYISLNGELVGEINKVEGTRTDYLTDALGSVVGTFAQEESAPSHITVLNTYRYKPYGGLLAKTGTSPDPRYLWTGNSGSRNSARRFAEQYNWHRHYGQLQGQWTTRDILWPQELAFGYVRGNPVSISDSFGLSPCSTSSVGRIGLNKFCYECIDHLQRSFKSFPNLNAAKKCRYLNKPCTNPMTLSPALMFCLKYKESSTSGSGDVVGPGAGNLFNLTSIAITQFCRESRSCLPAAIGLSQAGASSVENCTREIESNPALVNRLALMMFSCWPAGFGYVNPDWRKMFDNCVSCVELSIANSGSVGSSCPVWTTSSGGQAFGIPDCFTCIKGMEWDTAEKNKGNAIGEHWKDILAGKSKPR